MKQKEIVLVPFPFSDLSGKKVRPAMILSNDEYNENSDDVLVCAVTTTLKKSKYSIEINSNDLEKGVLYEKSLIKVENIVKIQKSMIIKTIGSINRSVFSKVIVMLNELVRF